MIISCEAACDVSFEMQSIEAENVWIAPADTVLYDEGLLEGITIKIRSAKNDQGGRGYKYYFARNRELSSTAAFDLGATAFFSYQGWLGSTLS